MPDSDDPKALTPQQQQRINTDYTRFLNASTLAACVLAPVIIALPPRKLDLFTFSLCGAFLASSNYQFRERTGNGYFGWMSRPFIEKHERLQQRTAASDGKRLLDEKITVSVKGSVMGPVAREDWKMQRLREEQEKLDEGEGYADMIKDQIWQVWNQEEKKVEDLKGKDDALVTAGKRDEKG
jgi:hypothetical protein